MFLGQELWVGRTEPEKPKCCDYNSRVAPKINVELKSNIEMWAAIGWQQQYQAIGS